MICLILKFIRAFIQLFKVASLILACVVFGALARLTMFVILYIRSIESPLFVWYLKFVKFLRMAFWKKIKTDLRFLFDPEVVSRGNSYIDTMLYDMFKNKSEEFDPYVLEDSSVGFHKKVMFVNVSGEAKLHDGLIKGLSTLHRADDCALKKEGNTLNVAAVLGAGELELHYKGSVKFMNFGPTTTVTGTLSYIEVYMDFSVNSETGRDGKLTNLEIDDMRGMKIKISGLGPLNWAVNPIVSGVTKIFKRFVQNFMEEKVEKHIREHIHNYQFPVEVGETTKTTSIEDTTPTGTLSPETEATKETPEPETEATEETPEPETESPEETPEPETESPEETPEPETESPEDLAESHPETAVPVKNSE